MFLFLFIFGWFHGSPNYFPIGASINGGCTAICFFVGFRYVRKIEYYVFRNFGGGMIFEIGRSGPDRERFDQFVAKVVERIKSLQQRSKA